MRKTALLFAIALPIWFASPAQAQIYYPWCAVYSGGRGGGATNCGFTSFQQCMATVSGIGGFCEQNRFYYERSRGRRTRSYDDR
jgi:uncharacterized protein DUF3551